MRKLTLMLMLISVLALVGIGCDSDRTLITSSDNSLLFEAALTGFPSADNIVSATLYVYVNQASGHTVSTHRVTADWDEMTVTWNNFGGSFDAAVEGSFLSDDTAYKGVDVTALVTAWLDGTYDNFGFLLEQEDMTSPRTELFSRDNASLNPYLEICYMVNSDPLCENVEAVADAYIYELYPDANTGGAMELNIGWFAETDLEKQALIRFEFPEEPPEEGCTRTIGFWKTHTGFGPQDDVVTPLLPITLGDGTGKSIVVTDAAMAHDILLMNVYGDPSNGITKLYAQLLGAKLNLASGASDDDISGALTEADEFLAEYDWTDWDSLTMIQQDMVNVMKSRFDDYNNGDLGPGHCDDDEEEENDD